MKVTARTTSALAGLIALLMAFNSIVFAFDSEPIDCCSVFQALESQSNVLYYSSFSVLPIKIINQLFAQSAGLAMPAKNDTPRNDQKKKDKSPLAYVPVTDLRTIVPCKELSGSAGAVYKGTGLQPGLRHRDPGNAASPPGGGAGIVLLIFFILIMTLLPRGNLDASAVMKAVRLYSIRPFRNYLTGFFIVSKNLIPMLWSTH